MLKNQEFLPLSDYQTDYLEEWVENSCDGGLFIAENFYLRKEELN